MLESKREDQEFERGNLRVLIELGVRGAPWQCCSLTRASAELVKPVQAIAAMISLLRNDPSKTIEAPYPDDEWIARMFAEARPVLIDIAMFCNALSDLASGLEGEGRMNEAEAVLTHAIAAIEEYQPPADSSERQELYQKMKQGWLEMLRMGLSAHYLSAGRSLSGVKVFPGNDITDPMSYLKGTISRIVDEYMEAGTGQPVNRNGAHESAGHQEEEPLPKKIPQSFRQEPLRSIHDGWVLEREGRDDEADARYINALQILKRENTEIDGFLFGELGRLVRRFVEREKFAQARRLLWLYRQACEKLRQCESPAVARGRQFESLLHEAVIAAHLKEPEDAEKHFQQAIQMSYDLWQKNRWSSHNLVKARVHHIWFLEEQGQNEAATEKRQTLRCTEDTVTHLHCLANMDAKQCRFGTAAKYEREVERIVR